MTEVSLRMLPPSWNDGLLAGWLESEPLFILNPVFIHTGGVQGLDQKRKLGFTACAALM
jgi:hypothetical protein